MLYRSIAALGIGALFFVSTSARAQMPFYVEAHGYVNVFTGWINNYTFVGGQQNGTGRLGLNSYSLSGIEQHARGNDPLNAGINYNTNPPSIIYIPATQSSDALLTGLVTPGTIHFAANSQAGENPPYIIANNGQKVLNGGAEGKATGTLSWGDTITIQSNALPKGTPVSVQFALSLSGGLGILGDTHQGQDANSAVINADLNVSLPGDNSITLSAGITANKKTFGTTRDFPGGYYTALHTANIGVPF